MPSLHPLSSRSSARRLGSPSRNRAATSAAGPGLSSTAAPRLWPTEAAAAASWLRGRRSRSPGELRLCVCCGSATGLALGSGRAACCLLRPVASGLDCRERGYLGAVGDLRPGPALPPTRAFDSFLTPPAKASGRAKLIRTHRPTRSTSGGLCCSYSPQAPLILTIAILVSGTAGGSRDQHGNGPPSVFPAAPESLCGPTSCFTDHSQRPRFGPAARPQTLGSGAYRSSREAAHRRSCGRLTTRGVSPRTSTHTGQGSALPCH